MAQSGIVIIKQGREKPILQRHPWVFSGAIDKGRTNLEGVQPGDIVEVRDTRGGYLATGYHNPHSQIRVRLLSWNQTNQIGPAWWRIQLARAIAIREAMFTGSDTDSYRLVNAENDGLPGLVVDRYGDYLVLQFLTMGVDVARESIVQALADLLNPAGIYERSDVDVRSKEGLEETTGVLYGNPPPDDLTITQDGVRYPVDILNGHKTGFYFDQRETRRWLRTHPEIAGREVLNCFSYTGAFSVCAGLNGASSITSVDSSGAAHTIARQAMAQNGLDDLPAEYVEADVFEQLRAYRDEERTFDLIILDPPKFAFTARQVDKAARGYKDINWLALQLLNPGGLLLTFSCSGHVSPDLFQKIVFGASVDAERDAQIVGLFNQSADHPVMLSFPEGHYLKGLACRA